TPPLRPSPPPKPQLRGPCLTLIGLLPLAYSLKVIKHRAEAVCGGPKSPERCGFRAFDGRESDSLPCLAGWRGALPAASLCCVVTPSPRRSTRSNADRQSTRAQGPHRAEAAGEDPCPARGASEAWCVHARVHDHAQEAELGSP